MSKRTCAVCAETIPSSRSNSAKYCSDSCARIYRQAWEIEYKSRRREIRSRNHAQSTFDDRKDGNLRRYGLTLSSFQEMLDSQCGVCAICRRPETAIDHHSGQPRRLAVDHCHATGRVRGLLCGNCNTVLGKVQDDPSRLRLAAEYLEQI